MKIYAVGNGHDPDQYFASKTTAQTFRIQREREMREHKRNGVVQIVECIIPDRITKEYLCDILSNYGMGFAIDQSTVYQRQFIDGRHVAKERSYVG